MKILNLFCLATTSLSLFSSQTFASTQIEGIAVSDAVTEAQSNRIQADLDYIKTMNFSNPDAEMLSLMQIQDSNASTLIDWLTDRVSYVVDENMNLQTSIGIAKKNYSYQNPYIAPIIETPTRTPDDPNSTSKVVTVMSNIGAALYYAGKQQSMLLDLNIDGIGKVKIVSPRTGILKVGQGLFATFKSLPFANDSKPYIAMRLSTLFHEARHSDGNGKSLGFFHATCPDGTYAGYAACDRNLNGPFQVESKFLNTLVSACTDCTDGDKVAIKTLAADAASRQIRSTPIPGSDADSLVKAVQTQIETCKLMAQLNINLPSMKCDMDALNKQLADLQAQAGARPGTPSVMWDATPEGI